jgi:DNA modification methylase
MRTYLVLKRAEHVRPSGIERDTFPPALVETFVKRYTISGELVLDPFAGFGTTLLVCDALGRRSIGVEFLSERADFIRGRIGALATIVHGDSRRIDELRLEPADMLITSPPYMHRGDTEDPLQGYTAPGRGYDSYLDGLRDIFARTRSVLKPDAPCIVNVSNIDRWDGLTLLAWDVARALAEVMHLEKEIVVCWDDDDHGFGYDHEYCLVFRNRPPKD